MAMVYIRNRTWPTGPNAVPWFMITNKTPDLSNLRIFGYLAYARTGKSRRNKFEDKAFKVFFVGYAFDKPTRLI